MTSSLPPSLTAESNIELELWPLKLQNLLSLFSLLYAVKPPRRPQNQIPAQVGYTYICPALLGVNNITP